MDDDYVRTVKNERAHPLASTPSWLREKVDRRKRDVGLASGHKVQYEYGDKGGFEVRDLPLPHTTTKAVLVSKQMGMQD